MFLVGIIVCFGWLFSLCLHEFSHAICAYWGGDTSVKQKGYLTFNPLKYTDPGHSLILPVLFLLMGGIGLPGGAVYINQHKLRNRWWQSAVSAAGPIANISIALALAIPFWVVPTQNLESIDGESFLASGIAFLIYLQVFAAIFNLLPIPGLDGYGIFEPWLSKRIQAKFNYFRKYSTLIIIGLFWYAPGFSDFVFTIVVIITNLLHVPRDLVIVGSELFRQPINKAIVIAVLLIIGWGLNSSKNTWNLIQTGNSLIKKGDYHSAIDWLDRAIDREPSTEEAWTQKAYCLWCLGFKDRAIACYQKALMINEHNEYAQKSLGHLLFEISEYRSAIPYLEKMLELEPDRIENYYYLGTSWQNLQEYILADEIFGRAIEIEPSSGQENDWWYKAICLEQLNLHERAITCYQQVLKINENNNDVRMQIGIIYFNLSQYESAIDNLEEAIELNDSDLNAYYYLGLSYRRLENLGSSSAAFDRALSLKPESSTVLHAYGELLHHFQDYKAAILKYQTLVDLAPNDATAWYDLACCQSLNGNIDLAISALQKAIEIDPDDLKKSALTDPDFSLIRQDVAFENLTA